MKKGFLCVIGFCSSWAYAADMTLCNYLFDIVIQNNTGTQCRLVQQSFNTGNTYSKTLPLVINAGEKSVPFTFETKIGFAAEDVDIDLSYSCGNDKMVTFKSKKMIEKYVVYNSATFEGLASSLSNMDADYVVQPQKCYAFQPRPDTMLWTFH